MTITEQAPTTYPVAPPAPGAPALTVEVTATVKVRQSVDLVTYYNGLSESSKKDYRRLNLVEVGYEAEWERPVAFLWPDEDELVPYQMVPEASSFTSGDISDATIRLSMRNGNRVYGREAEWTEADFAALSEQVPWITDVYAEKTRILTPEEIARQPGPNDRPLF